MDLTNDEVGHAVKEVFLSVDVVVERHRLDAQLLGEATHAQSVDSLAIGKLDGGASDALTIERISPRLGSHFNSG